MDINRRKGSIVVRSRQKHAQPMSLCICCLAFAVSRSFSGAAGNGTAYRGER
jgi:hypothetical protein